MKIYLRTFIALLAVTLAVAFGVGSAQASWPAAGPHGEQCSVDTFTFYGLTNTINPGEIGFKTNLGCNFAMFQITGHQWLSNAGPNGTWQSIDETYAQKGKTNVISLTMTSWYSCGSVDSFASNHLESKASWQMDFDTGFSSWGDNATEHWSKCYFPRIVSFQ